MALEPDSIVPFAGPVSAHGSSCLSPAIYSSGDDTIAKERIKALAMMLTLLAAAAVTGAPDAKVCDGSTYGALTAPTTPGDKPFLLTCTVVLKKGDNIPRRILLLGKAASGVKIDCNGGAIGYDGIVPPQQGNDVRTGSPFANPTLWIATQKEGQDWSVPTDISISRCTIYGNIRTSGIYTKSMFDRSRQPDFTKFAQENAPRRIDISHTTIVGYRHVPLYIGVGTTYVTFRDSKIIGSGESGVYLDLESGHNDITGNKFDLFGISQVISIDGSADNKISGNSFTLYNKDGIHLYRNCGEDGIIRHQSPSNNIISDNKFMLLSDNLHTVVVNSRSGRYSNVPERDPKICDLDKGFAFGSSKDDNDNGKNNSIYNNTIVRQNQ